jgi:carbon-monoxide dehydrogenase small subunit
MLDGDAVRSCLMLAAQAEGCSIRTVEGLAGADGALNPLQLAFRQYHALQCGFCTPGVLMTLQALLEQGTLPRSETEIREAISGNLCRCTGYQGMVDAVLSLAP